MDPYGCQYEFSNITVDFTTAESFRQGQTAYYLLLYFVQHPAETINAMRAWVQQCEKLINIPRDGIRIVIFKPGLVLEPEQQWA